MDDYGRGAAGPDFESDAFNRARPPLRAIESVIYFAIFSVAVARSPGASGRRPEGRTADDALTVGFALPHAQDSRPSQLLDRSQVYPRSDWTGSERDSSAGRDWAESSAQAWTSQERDPRFGVSKCPMFGKTVGSTSNEAPNHIPRVARTERRPLSGSTARAPPPRRPYLSGHSAPASAADPRSARSRPRKTRRSSLTGFSKRPRHPCLPPDSCGCREASRPRSGAVVLTAREEDPQHAPPAGIARPLEGERLIGRRRRRGQHQRIWPCCPY
jgi:hypothetical protein